MKQISCLLLVLLLAGSAGSTYCQTADPESATVHFYRLKESMMSGGTGMNVKIYFADKEIGSMMTNTRFSYKLLSTGPIKIKCVGEMAGGAIGTPYVVTMNLEKGKEYHIALACGSMTGVKGQILEEKDMKKYLKNEYADSVIAEEKK
ncbi:MAG TPA: hypothetical protein PKG48_07185 [Bacteroidales bacterium]|nr:hypothetical protein [Bacteroidales bacterium]HPS63294.1 hypothetical protein [Bacteroidales bacterium]